MLFNRTKGKKTALKRLRKITAKSRLTEQNAITPGRKINRQIAKRHKTVD